MRAYKFIIYLKSGKVFETYDKLTDGQFEQIKSSFLTSMRNNIDGVVYLSGCCIRLSEVAVAEWERM